MIRALNAKSLSFIFKILYVLGVSVVNNNELD
jgi:hypothetical protein